MMAGDEIGNVDPTASVPRGPSGESLMEPGAACLGPTDFSPLATGAPDL